MPTFPGPGQELGGYRIERLIGRGGMSVVYLAEQLALGRKVALKLLSEELSEDEEFRRRFIRESRLAAGLEHPNIIPVHEAGEVEGLLFIAMRYVEGSDLKALLQREGQLSLERTIEMIGQAASALDAAHARGLVHRDVKPGNLLVASGEGPEANEHIYLSDFGLTKKTDSKSRMTSTGQFVGTLDYVAPEQIQGKEVSKYTDLYSLACVVCECLTGKAPYERDSEVAVMYAHLQDPPPKPTQLRSDLPGGVDQAIERAMAKEPQARYDSCREFMKALRVASGATADSGPQRAPRVGRRKRAAPAVHRPSPEPDEKPTPVAPVVGSQEVTRPDAPAPAAVTMPARRPARSFNTKIAAAVAIPLLAGAAFMMTRGGAEPPTDANDDPTTGAGAVPTSNGGGEEGSGREADFTGQLAFLEETSPGSGRFFVAVADPPDESPTQVPGTTGADWRNRRPDWVASGNFFAFGHPDPSGDLDIVVVDATSPDRPVATLEAPGAQGSVAVSPDGEQVAFSQEVDSNLDIYVWDVASSQTRRLTTFDGDDDSPEWSSDGSQIVFEREATDGNDIFIMNADGSNLERVTETPAVNEKLPEFNPVDETLIVYHQQETGGDFGIYVHDTDAPPIETGIKIIDTPDSEMRPTWSPDGTAIAYDSDASGDLDIFIIAFGGLEDPPSPRSAIRITDGPNDEQSPAWGPDRTSDP